MTLVTVAEQLYGAGSVAILRVIYNVILSSEYMSRWEKFWRGSLSFVLWPLLLAVVLLKATFDFFRKGTYPQ